MLNAFWVLRLMCIEVGYYYSYFPSSLMILFFTNFSLTIFFILFTSYGSRKDMIFGFYRKFLLMARAANIKNENWMSDNLLKCSGCTNKQTETGKRKEMFQMKNIKFSEATGHYVNRYFYFNLVTRVILLLFGGFLFIWYLGQCGKIYCVLLLIVVVVFSEWELNHR